MMIKRVQKLGVLGLAMFLLAGLPGCLCYVVPGNAVFFPDQALESAVRSAIGKPFGCITEGDLLQLTELRAPALNIRDLRGLEKCPNLETLDLRSNLIRSITPLTNLRNLRWINLGDNRIEDIGPLAGLFFLDYLDLFGAENDIQDFRPLAANALAGGLGATSTVILDRKWTLNNDLTIDADFQPVYDTLRSAGVTVRFVQSDGTIINF